MAYGSPYQFAPRSGSTVPVSAPFDPRTLVPVNRAQPVAATPATLYENRAGAQPPSSFAGNGPAYGATTALPPAIPTYAQDRLAQRPAYGGTTVVTSPPMMPPVVTTDPTVPPVVTTTTTAPPETVPPVATGPTTRDEWRAARPSGQALMAAMQTATTPEARRAIVEDFIASLREWAAGYREWRQGERDERRAERDAGGFVPPERVARPTAPTIPPTGVAMTPEEIEARMAARRGGLGGGGLLGTGG